MYTIFYMFSATKPDNCELIIRHRHENVSRKNSLLSKLMKNMLTRKKHQMVTYIIGKAYDKKCLRHNIKKNCRTLIAKKKACFPPEVKKKVCKQQKL